MKGGGDSIDAPGSSDTGIDGPPPKVPTFVQPAKRFFTTYGQAGGIAVGDFSSDGIPDVITFDPSPTSGITTVFVSDGHGSFADGKNASPGSGSPAVAISAGLMGNTTEGAAVANNAGNGMSLFTSDATGMPSYFTNYNFTFGDPPNNGQASAMAPLDTGTKSWIVEGTSAGLVLATPSSGNNYNVPGSKYLPGTSVTGVALDKLQGGTETTPDVIAVGTETSGSNVYVLLNNGAGALGLPQALALPAAPKAVATGDVNGGGIDIVAATADHLFVFLNENKGMFATTPAHSYVAPATISGVALADFNGDGKIDIAVACNGADEVAVFTGNGDGSFNPPVVFAAGQEVTGIGVADFNGDHLPDIVVGGFEGINLLQNSTM